MTDPAPEALSERKRIHNALRRIAIRFKDRPGLSENPELTIRRAIEEIFDEPLPWEDETTTPPAKARR